MIRVEVGTTDNSHATVLTFPSEPDEITLEKMLELTIRHEESKTSENILTDLIRGLSGFLDLDEWQIIGTTEIGDLDAHIKALQDDKYLNVTELTGQIVTMYNWIYGVIQRYEPDIRIDQECYYFTFPSDEYTIENGVRFKKQVAWRIPLVIDGQRDTTTAKAIEAMDTIQGFAKNAEKCYRENEDGDKELINRIQLGSLEYSKLVKLIAIFAEHPNDKPCNTIDQWKARIERRFNHFKQINMRVALDVGFFLRAYM